jgi:hypothetical protein
LQPGPTHSRRRRLLAATSLVGLLLAVAGLTPAATAVETLQGRLVLDLPTWLAVPFIVLVGLEALLIGILLVTGPRPRRKTWELQRGTVAPVLMFIATVALFGGLKNYMGIDIAGALRGALEITGAPVLTEPEGETPQEVHSALASGIMEGLLLTLALIGFAVVGWLYLAILPERTRGATAVPAPAALHKVVEDSLDDLRHLADARLAIIRCYDRFERVLAGAHVHRSPWQTVMEFMRTALQHAWLPRDSVRELTQLFEIARFSRHEVGPQHRERAWQALMAVKAALEKEELHAPAA